MEELTIGLREQFDLAPWVVVFHCMDRRLVIMLRRRWGWVVKENVAGRVADDAHFAIDSQRCGLIGALVEQGG